MAMLDRYRKSGGFMQLLQLVETCGLTKQEKFLEIIRAEDPRWADALRAKMLDVERIFSWNDETLAEIIGALQDLTVATLLHWAQEPIKSRITATFSHSRRRKIDDLFDSQSPNAGDIAATHIKLIETVRSMLKDGLLRFDKFAPELVIEDAIEEKIGRSGLGSYSAPVASTAVPLQSSDPLPIEVPPSHAPEAAESGVSEASEVRMIELQNLKRRCAELTRENSQLRHELALAKGKLEQIRKIA